MVTFPLKYLEYILVVLSLITPIETKKVFFISCYLAGPQSILGHYQGDSLNHPMLITAFYIFDPKVTGSLVTRLGL